MIGKCRAICIRTINYSESSVVLQCYTDRYGLQSYMINGVRSKKGTIRPSQLFPLTLLELEVYHQQNKSLQRIKELRCVPSFKHLHFDVIKSSIGIFVAEIINKTIREENQTDENLFEYLFHAIQILDLETHNASNFPLYFVVQLSKYIGFFPKGSYSIHTNGFDGTDGEFIPYDARNPYQLTPPLSEKLSSFIQGSFESYHELQLTNAQRNELLDFMLDYYRKHIDTLHEVKSHKVLNEVLS